jgi:hypothetical protein
VELVHRHDVRLCCERRLGEVVIGCRVRRSCRGLAVAVAKIDRQQGIETLRRRLIIFAVQRELAPADVGGDEAGLGARDLLCCAGIGLQYGAKEVNRRRILALRRRLLSPLVVDARQIVRRRRFLAGLFIFTKRELLLLLSLIGGRLRAVQ